MKTKDCQTPAVELEGSAQRAPRRLWIIVAILGVAQFITVLNFQSVTLVLPAIQHSLGFSAENLQWVVSANALAFGGGLLVAGRLADIFGHRRIFVCGLLLSTISASGCGLATSQFMLVFARILQGMATALMIPAALALIIDLSPQGTLRYRALGAWGIFGSIGGVAGTLLGSFFADRYGWPSIFFLNVPFGLLALPAAIVLLPPAQKSRDVVALDLPGALLSTCSLVLLITGLTQIVHPSVNYLLLLACFGGFLIFFLLFCFIEAHVKYPLVPLHFFRQPNVAGSTMVTLAFCATANTVLFFFTLYMQQVHGFSSFITGLAFLPTNVMLILGSFGAPLLIKRWGYKLTILIGLLFLAGGALLYARISVTGEYVWTLLPGLAAVGTGLGICQVAATGVGTHQVGPTERGLVSSLLNVASQVGTALGLAVLVSVANARTLMLAHNSRPSPEDLVAGFQWAFYAGAAFSLLGIVLLFLTIKRRQA